MILHPMDIRRWYGNYWLRTEGEPASQLKARAIFWHKAMDRYFQTWHNDPDCLTIRYENLCSDPMAIVRQVCLHLNIDPNPPPHLPDAFEKKNRLTRWHQLEDGLKEMVHAEISAVQDRMDKIFLSESAYLNLFGIKNNILYLRMFSSCKTIAYDPQAMSGMRTGDPGTHRQKYCSDMCRNNYNNRERSKSIRS